MAIWVDGNEILFDGIKVGELAGGWPTLRDRLLEVIDGAEPDMFTERDHLKAVEEARQEGIEEGKTDAAEEVDERFETRKDEIYEQGWTHGRASAIVDMKRGQDAVRVDALLTAVSEAHDLLFAVAHKRYPTAKLGELKNASLLTLSKLRSAVQAWRLPNGADE